MAVNQIETSGLLDQ